MLRNINVKIYKNNRKVDSNKLLEWSPAEITEIIVVFSLETLLLMTRFGHYFTLSRGNWAESDFGANISKFI